MKIGNKNIKLSEIHPIFYTLASEKEVLRRNIKDFREHNSYATTIASEDLPFIISGNSSNLIKKGPGIDPALQYNKAKNVEIAFNTMNRLIIEPGEVFSFWKRVGRISPRKGYQDGRVIMGDQVEAGIGGGLCNLANSINLLILHSPLDITEMHTHSDALAADPNDQYVPFANGTSVGYKSVDYRFKNNTQQRFQLRFWIADDKLYTELRSDAPVTNTYRLVDEDHHFARGKDQKFYRNAKIYREEIGPDGAVLAKELILDNHSEVMFDEALIPQHLIREN